MISIQNKQVERQKGSLVVISGEITPEAYTSFKAPALVALAERVSIDGFRKGKVPEAILLKHIGEQALLVEIAERAVSEAYRTLITEESLDVVADPQITLTKLAVGNPIGFSISIPVMPSVGLPEYKAIAKRENAKKEPLEVSEKEVGDAVFEIRKSRIPAEVRDSGELKAEDFEKHMPALDDAFVQTLGDFKNVEEFTHKLREHLVKQKEEAASDKRRGAIADALIEKTEVDLPDAFVQSELVKMTEQLKSDVARIGISWEEYLKRINKSETDLKNDWKDEATKRVKLQLVLHKIAEEEKLTPDPEEVHAEAHHLLQHYPDADHDRVISYVASMKVNEMVWRFLDNDGVMPPPTPKQEHGHDHDAAHHVH